MALQGDQVRRYSRHVLLPDVGGLGQQRWLTATVRLARLDAAGQAALLYLAAAGVGRLIVDDGGRVTAAGPLFLLADVGRPAAEAAAERVRALNPDARVVAAGADDADALQVESVGAAGAAGAAAGDDAAGATDDPAAALGAGATAARRVLRALIARPS